MKVVLECQINTSTKSVADSLKEVKLEEDEVIVSFDVSSLYTNVPVQEAIDTVADLLYSGEHQLPPVDKSTFKELARLCTCDVLMKTHDGFYRQIDGLAMGSPPAPLLANAWLSKYDQHIRDNAKLYARYMDDILRSIKRAEVQSKLAEINRYHPFLKFTIEEENEQFSLSFLDMLIYRLGTLLYSTWFMKANDTSLVMNYHALAPRRYKQSVVAGFVHRIHRACSTWENFHASLQKAKRILEQNQYPPEFYEPVIQRALDKIVGVSSASTISSGNTLNEQGETERLTDADPIRKRLIFIEYRGKVTDDYCRALKRIEAPCQPVLTLRKLKTVMPTLKPAIDKKVRNHVVYRITCPRCKSCYISATCRCLDVRFGEHMRPSQPVGKHLRECHVKEQTTLEDVEILASTTRSTQFLFTLEALWQKEERPTINTRDEYKSHELTIMW